MFSCRSLDSTQLEITDANATGSKFRSYYIGNISKNLNFPVLFQIGAVLVTLERISTANRSVHRLVTIM